MSESTIVKSPKTYKLPIIPPISLIGEERIGGGEINQAFLFMSKDGKEREFIQNSLVNNDPMVSIGTFTAVFRSLVEKTKSSKYRKLGVKLFGDANDRSIAIANNGTLFVAAVDNKTFKAICSKKKRVSEVWGPTQLAFYIQGADETRDAMVEEAKKIMEEYSISDRLFIEDH